MREAWSLAQGTIESGLIIQDNLQYLELKRLSEKRIVATSGCFDILHAGHVKLFRWAKRHGTFLVVFMNDDRSPYWGTKPGRPIVPCIQRSILLDALSDVDCVYMFSGENPTQEMGTLKPDVFVKGGDYEESDIPEAEWAGEVLFFPYIAGLSTSSIIEKIRCLP